MLRLREQVRKSCGQVPLARFTVCCTPIDWQDLYVCVCDVVISCYYGKKQTLYVPAIVPREVEELLANNKSFEYYDTFKRCRAISKTPYLGTFDMTHTFFIFHFFISV